MSVQYQVQWDYLYEAFYLASDIRSQIQVYVLNAVRSAVAALELDQVYLKREEIALKVRRYVQVQMQQFGYYILTILIIEVQPDVKVKAAMNEINAATRLKLVAKENAQAQKFQMIKSAEAFAASLYLEGVGISKYRQTIIKGLSETTRDLKNDLHGITQKQITEIVMLTQYFQTLQEIGNRENSNVIFLPQNYQNIGDNQLNTLQQIMESENFQRYKYQNQEVQLSDFNIVDDAQEIQSG